MLEAQRKEAEARKAEEKQLEIRRRETPKLAPIKEGANVEDFLEEFETQMEDLQMPVDRWMPQLRPLLSVGMRDAIAILPQEARAEYATAKAKILEAYGIRQGRLGDRFWRAVKPRGVSYTSICPKWMRLLKRYVGEDATYKKFVDAILREKLLQSLPTIAATHVRDKNPTTMTQAAVMADQFFEDRQSYPEHPRWQKRSAQERQQEKSYQPKERILLRYPMRERHNSYPSQDRTRSL